MSPDERVYCGDYWCDGDHLSHSEKCGDLDQDDIDMALIEPPC